MKPDLQAFKEKRPDLILALEQQVFLEKMDDVIAVEQAMEAVQKEIDEIHELQASMAELKAERDELLARIGALDERRVIRELREHCIDLCNTLGLPDEARTTHFLGQLMKIDDDQWRVKLIEDRKTLLRRVRQNPEGSLLNAVDFVERYKGIVTES